MRQERERKDKVPHNRRACDGSHGSVEGRRRAGEYGRATGRLPERLMALMARFTSRVGRGRTHAEEEGGERPSLLACLSTRRRAALCNKFYLQQSNLLTFTLERARGPER